MKTNDTGQKGFTLIEIIVTLVIAALMGAVIFAYMGPILTRSHEPIGHVSDLGEAIEIMEEVTAKYQEFLFGTSDWGDSSNPSGTDNFLGWLENRTDIQHSDESATLGTAFEAIRVTVTIGNQTVSALFTQ